MKNHKRCPACNRRRKKAHDFRAMTTRAYSPDCLSIHKNFGVEDTMCVVSPGAEVVDLPVAP